MTAAIPTHVAIIMDGNGRWARSRYLPRVAGHRAGSKAVKSAIQFCVKQRIQVLTLFALSVENKMFRPAEEVNFLMSLFAESLASYTAELHTNKVRVRIIGDLSALPAALLRQIEHTQALTSQNTGLQLNIAMNYSGRWDMVQAVKQLIRQGTTECAIDEALLSSKLSLAELPPPDLLIRTSGEKRISNFMLWQLAYTELYFTDVFWPDFNDTIFADALASFQQRDRRYGLVKETNEQQHA